MSDDLVNDNDLLDEDSLGDDIQDPDEELLDQEEGPEDKSLKGKIILAVAALAIVGLLGYGLSTWKGGDDESLLDQISTKIDEAVATITTHIDNAAQLPNNRVPYSLVKDMCKQVTGYGLVRDSQGRALCKRGAESQIFEWSLVPHDNDCPHDQETVRRCAD